MLREGRVFFAPLPAIPGNERQGHCISSLASASTWPQPSVCPHGHPASPVPCAAKGLQGQWQMGKAGAGLVWINFKLLVPSAGEQKTVVGTRLWAASTDGCEEPLPATSPVTFPHFPLRLEHLPYLRPRTVGKRAGGHPLGTTWRWDSAGAGDEGQLASAAWSRPGWQGSPRLWESE